MSHATVYKTLALLKEIGQVLEIDLRDDSHYDGNRPQPHPHLICTECKAISDVKADLEHIRDPEAPHGLRATRISAPRSRSMGFARACRQGSP